jgi:hypothetical protein
VEPVRRALLILDLDEWAGASTSAVEYAPPVLPNEPYCCAQKCAFEFLESSALEKTRVGYTYKDTARAKKLTQEKRIHHYQDAA